ncbi:DNA helicase [Rhizobium phaseoli]|nr:DNA helicase [Rhizobium phaseoli]RDJ00943.1 DNA helicase [Rhizobium phaseoli]
MAGGKKPKSNRPTLEDRFTFVGDAVAPGNRATLRSAMFEVEDKVTGQERVLKLWHKTGTDVDDDLRGLWRHEMRQVQRVMAYTGAREVIVDILEFVEDDENFGVVLERVGRPLDERLKRAPKSHWMRNLGAPRPRALLWRNIQRLVTALGIVHSQGLVHGRLSPEVIMTDLTDEPDFQLGGFEWSLWLNADSDDRAHAKIAAPDVAQTQRAESYSFASDWRALGLLIAHCFGLEMTDSGDVTLRSDIDSPISLQISERVLLKRLIRPARMEQLDAESISRAIDDLIVSLGRATTARAGTFVLIFDASAKLGDAVYDASEGEIAVDEWRRQLQWAQADIDGGATLLVPKSFDPQTSSIRLVTDNMVYRLHGFRDDGAMRWDIAICRGLEIRNGRLSLNEVDEHRIAQRVTVALNSRDARETAARIGPDILDWSAFAVAAKDAPVDEVGAVRQALILLQAIEAIVKALDVFPVQILDRTRSQGRRFVICRAEPNNDRDAIAKKIGLHDSGSALRRLFEEEHQDADAKWRFSQAPSLGANRLDDVAANFVDLVEHRGRRAYRFEVDEDLPPDGPYFLRIERDAGTEKVIARRLRNIKALNTRADLAEMLADPWRVRRSSREALSDAEMQDPEFLDLDVPKQNAFKGLWSTLPGYFVVGPPGVGKTKLATEVVRRRFVSDRSSRLLVSAQGHDALDNLQEKIKETLAANALNDLLVVRSATGEKRPTNDDEVQKVGLGYIADLDSSNMAKSAPAPLRERLSILHKAAKRREAEKNALSKEQRSDLGAVANLVLDAANIVISTANSPDIERLVEARAQFDWVLVEEAAKATGPELVGPLMLSGRRLLIGDHNQLPPFDAERLLKVLSDHSLTGRALGLVETLVAPLLRDGELDELQEIAKSDERLRDTASLAVRLLEPFRTAVTEDENRALANPGHRAIAATLSEQRRMDPAIAEIVSKAFYQGRLTTEARRAEAAELKPAPVTHLNGLPASPVVVIDAPHVSATGQAEPMEKGSPRWHNPSEVKTVVAVLQHLRARDPSKPPTLAILSPYNAQVDKLHEAVTRERRHSLQHLDDFRSVRSNGAFVGTIDSFQGGEADVVVLSLVRNNPMSGGRALGFLRDHRRMNVALSRAKSQLIIVGSLSFLREAVRGVNPESETHNLSFLTTITDTITDLETRLRCDVPLATVIPLAKFLGTTK